MARHGIKNAADGRRLHQRGRAAAEKDGGDGAVRSACRGRCDLGREGAYETILIDRGAPHMAVEVAIRAFRQAKRPVNVDAELRRIAFVSFKTVRRISTIQD